jgi:hypothetical protein
MRHICATALAVLALVCLAATAGFGQVADGNIIGTVLDASGAAVPNANVTLENIATGVKTSAKSDENGLYRFNNVLIGRYTVTISAAGFSTAALRDVGVELNKTTTANAKLEVGNVSTTVEVADAATAVDTTTAQLASTYQTRLAADLPAASNPTGGLLNLSLLGAGVASSGGIGVGTGPSVGGQRPRNNNFMIEGVDDNRKDITGPIITVPNDAVAEFTVIQNQFSVEFGHSSGGMFNTVVKGGGNDVHGVLSEYLLNRKLNAIDQSYKRQGIYTNPRYDINTLNGGIGGPIRKNKLFYYGLFQYQPDGEATTPAAPIWTPTSAGFNALANIPGLSSTNLNIFKTYVPPSAAPDPSKAPAAVGGVNIPLGIIQNVAPSYTNTYIWLVSIDYTLSQRDQLRGRYLDRKVTNIDTTAPLPTFWATQPVTAKVFTFSEFHNFRSNLINELRLAFNRYNSTLPVPDFQYPGLDVFPNIRLPNDLAINIGPNQNGPQFTIQNTYQAVENLSWIKGRHDLKFGAEVRDLTAVSTFIQRVRGDYGYSSLERYLLDQVPDVIAQRNVGGKPYSGNQMAFYSFANDNWRATRNLSINLGVRYEFTQVPRSMREFALNSLADVPGVLTFFEPKPQKRNFAPRVGFAYTPGNSGRTSIRGGFGIAYDQIFDNVGTNARPPQATSTVDADVTNATGFLKNGGILPTAPTGTLTPAQARALTSSWLPDQKVGYAITWNFGVQRQLNKDTTFESRYVGTKGVHLIFQTQLNRAAVVTPTHSLPTFLSAPSQATLDALTLTQGQLQTERDTPGLGKTMAQYGFTSNITAYVPQGNSEYHGLALELNKRFSAHHLFKLAYTWSHTMDDSTAEVNSTVLAPRRPQDFNNIRSEWASSLLDRRQRFSATWVWETPWFARDTNWIKRNLLSNYEISGTYIVESPQYGTPQSSVDSNLNGDAATDRAVYNPNGVAGTSSAVTALCKGGPCSQYTAAQRPNFTVGYLAANPNAQYIAAGVGVFPTTGRNTLRMAGINNWDLAFFKNVNFSERWRLNRRADFYNAFNHPQYTPGRINNVNLKSRSDTNIYLIPGSSVFGAWDQVFSSNPRFIQLGARLTF